MLHAKINNTGGILSYSQTASLPWWLQNCAKRNRAVHRTSSHATEMNHSQFSWLIEFLILCRCTRFLRPKQDNKQTFRTLWRMIHWHGNKILAIYDTVHDPNECPHCKESFRYLHCVEQKTAVCPPHDIYPVTTATVLASKRNSVGLL